MKKEKGRKGEREKGRKGEREKGRKGEREKAKWTRGITDRMIYFGILRMDFVSFLSQRFTGACPIKLFTTVIIFVLQ